jgi:hypothetical protein
MIVLKVKQKSSEIHDFRRLRGQGAALGQIVSDTL